MKKQTARRLLFVISAWLLFGGLVCLSQAQVPMTGAGKGVPGAVAYQGPGDVVSGALWWAGLRGYNTAYTGNAANICTPLDAVCLDVTIVGGALNTTTLGTLACNNLTTICTVKILYDQSGNSNCGGPCDFTQATIASRPIYVASGAANGCSTTAFPCMAFVSGTPGLISPNFSPVAVSQPYTASGVVNRTGDTGNFRDWVTLTGTTLVGAPGSANTMRMSAGAELDATASDNAFHAIQALFDTTCNLYIDGGGNTGACGSDPVQNGATFRIGSNFSASGYTGKVLEAGLWSVGFSAGNLTSMNSNQHSYWGF